jgi:dTDP-4-dehydrorhamnose 3,5-epimerase
MTSILSLSFPEVKILLPKIHEDNRGYKYSYYSEKDFIDANINFKIKETYVYNIPKANTLYGIHYQIKNKEQQKLIRLLSGSGIDYVIDLRKESETFRKWISIEISAINQKQVLVPPGFGHLFRSTTDNVTMLFGIDEYFDSNYCCNISYKDPEIHLDIMNETFILSDYDEIAPLLKDSDL